MVMVMVMASLGYLVYMYVWVTRGLLGGKLGSLTNSRSLSVDQYYRHGH